MGPWMQNGVDISPEGVARDYASDNWYPQSAEEDAEQRLEESLLELLDELFGKLGIKRIEPVSM